MKPTIAQQKAFNQYFDLLPSHLRCILSESGEIVKSIDEKPISKKRVSREIIESFYDKRSEKLIPVFASKYGYETRYFLENELETIKRLMFLFSIDEYDYFFIPFINYLKMRIRSEVSFEEHSEKRLQECFQSKTISWRTNMQDQLNCLNTWDEPGMHRPFKTRLDRSRKAYMAHYHNEKNLARLPYDFKETLFLQELIDRIEQPKTPYFRGYKKFLNRTLNRLTMPDTKNNEPSSNV